MFDNASDYTFINCCTCGCRFGVPNDFERGRRGSKESFYCPNGHSLSYKTSEADRLRQERDRLKQQTARLEDEAREARERADRAEAATKRLKKRAAAGNCPACKRTFANMAEHMKHMHPEFVCDSGAKVVPIKRRA